MKRKAAFLYFGVFILAFIVLGYWSILQKKPQSIHRWRQSDSATIAYNYYAKDFHFFHPEVLYLVADHGKSGYTVSEFPGYYYLIASVWKIVGHSDSVYRLISVLFTFIGLFYLFKLSHLLLKDLFWSLSVPFLLITSTVFVYYGNNFTTDVPAFSLAMIYCFHLVSFYQNSKTKHLYFALIFVLFAGLTKIITLIPFLAFMGVFCLMLLKKWFNGAIESKVIQGFKGKQILLFFIPLLVIAWWYVFAMRYNAKHHTTFFSTTFFPIWDMSKDEMLLVWQKGFLEWKKEIFNFTVWILLGFCLLYVLVFYKKLNQFLFMWLSFIFVGTLAYIALWFYCFKDHDYYYIHTYYLVIGLVLLVLLGIKENHSKFFYSRYVKVVLAVIFILNLYNAQFLLKKRYTSSINDYVQYETVHHLGNFLKSIGVNREDKIISLPDETPNTTLYLLQQPGWTQAFQDNLDSLSVQRKIDLGAKYLITVGEEPITRLYLKSFLVNKIGQFRDVRIFKLDTKKV